MSYVYKPLWLMDIWECILQDLGVQSVNASTPFMHCAICSREELEAFIWVMVSRLNEPDYSCSKDE